MSNKIFNNKAELDVWIDERFPVPKEWTWNIYEPSQESIAEKLIEEGYDLDNLLADGHGYEINGHTNNGWAYRDEIDQNLLRKWKHRGEYERGIERIILLSEYD